MSKADHFRQLVRTRALSLPGGWMPSAIYRMTMMAIDHVTETSNQMKSAPRRAVFICCNSEHDHVEYARQLAKQLGRDDLEIWPPSMLDDQRNVTRSFTGVVLDHAAMLTSKQTYSLVAARQRVKYGPDAEKRGES